MTPKMTKIELDMNINQPGCDSSFAPDEIDRALSRTLQRAGLRGCLTDNTVVNDALLLRFKRATQTP